MQRAGARLARAHLEDDQCGWAVKSHLSNSQCFRMYDADWWLSLTSPVPNLLAKTESCECMRSHSLTFRLHVSMRKGMYVCVTHAMHDT